MREWERDGQRGVTLLIYAAKLNFRIWHPKNSVDFNRQFAPEQFISNGKTYKLTTLPPPSLFFSTALCFSLPPPLRIPSRISCALFRPSLVAIFYLTKSLFAFGTFIKHLLCFSSHCAPSLLMLLLQSQLAALLLRLFNFATKLLLIMRAISYQKSSYICPENIRLHRHTDVHTLTHTHCI